MRPFGKLPVGWHAWNPHGVVMCSCGARTYACNCQDWTHSMLMTRMVPDSCETCRNKKGKK